MTDFFGFYYFIFVIPISCSHYRKYRLQDLMLEMVSYSKYPLNQCAERTSAYLWQHKREKKTRITDWNPNNLGVNGTQLVFVCIYLSICILMHINAINNSNRNGYLRWVREILFLCGPIFTLGNSKSWNPFQFQKEMLILWKPLQIIKRHQTNEKFVLLEEWIFRSMYAKRFVEFRNYSELWKEKHFLVQSNFWCSSMFSFKNFVFCFHRMKIG